MRRLRRLAPQPRPPSVALLHRPQQRLFEGDALGGGGDGGGGDFLDSLQGQNPTYIRDAESADLAKVKNLFHNARAGRCQLCGEGIGNWAGHTMFVPHQARLGIVERVLSGACGHPDDVVARWWDKLNADEDKATNARIPGMSSSESPMRRKRMVYLLRFLHAHGVLKESIGVFNKELQQIGRSWEFERLEMIGDNIVKSVINDRMNVVFPQSEGGLSSRLQMIQQLVDSNEGLLRAYDYLDCDKLIGSRLAQSKFKSDVVEALFGELQVYLWATKSEYLLERYEPIQQGPEQRVVRALAEHALYELTDVVLMFALESTVVNAKDILRQHYRPPLAERLRAARPEKKADQELTGYAAAVAVRARNKNDVRPFLTGSQAQRNAGIAVLRGANAQRSHDDTLRIDPPGLRPSPPQIPLLVARARHRAMHRDDPYAGRPGPREEDLEEGEVRLDDDEFDEAPSAHEHAARDFAASLSRIHEAPAGAPLNPDWYVPLVPPPEEGSLSLAPRPRPAQCSLWVEDSRAFTAGNAPRRESAVSGGTSVYREGTSVRGHPLHALRHLRFPAELEPTEAPDPAYVVARSDVDSDGIGCAAVGTVDAELVTATSALRYTFEDLTQDPDPAGAFEWAPGRQFALSFSSWAAGRPAKFATAAAANPSPPSAPAPAPVACHRSDAVADALEQLWDAMPLAQSPQQRQSAAC